MQVLSVSPQFTNQRSRVSPTLANSNVSLNAHQTEIQVKSNKPRQDIVEAQEIISSFFIKIVKQWSAELVLNEFKNLFINPIEVTNKDARQAINQIISCRDEEKFVNTLKRCCYILLNNWIAGRQYKPTQDLVQLLYNIATNYRPSDPNSRYLKSWLKNFINTKDYQELKLFVAKYENKEKEKEHWKSRYTSYLLVSQYADSKNPTEQRQAAKALSKQLQDQFKFDLAMYTARSKPLASKDCRSSNPTALGDEALRLVKKVVAKRGSFSYKNLANIFIKQTQQSSHKDFKQSLIKYLIFSEENKGLVETIKASLGEKLEHTYENSHREQINNNLLLKTCNRVIEHLTTEKQGEPSQLFVSLASQGNPLTLAVILLKIILICKQSRTHLELCIAKLIQYYDSYSSEECSWVINFLEIAKIIMAIHTENVRYNLVNMRDNNLNGQPAVDENDYRVFSQS